MNRRTTIVTVASVLGLAAFVLLPFGVGEYWIFVVTLVAVYSLAGVGLTVLTGWAGQIALAQAGFMAVGAYGTNILTDRGLPWPLALVAAALVCAVAGVLVGLPAIRLQGLYLAIATLAFGELSVQGLNAWTDVTGGPSGTTVEPFLIGDLPASVSTYYIALAITAAAFILVCAAGRRGWGRRLKAVRDIEVATASLSISATRTKLSAFVASAVAAGVAGGLFGQLLGFMSPAAFGLPLMVQLLVIVFVGGVRFASGAVLGAVIVVGLRQGLQDVGSAQTLAYGVLLLLVLVVMPTGLASPVQRVVRKLMPRGAPRPATVPTARPDADADADAEFTLLSDTPVLSVSGLAVRFGGNTVIKDVDLAIPYGFTGLLGPNGAGKTTLFNAITGYVDPAAGEILLEGDSLIGRGPVAIARAGVARTFQTPRLVPDLTVRENVLLGSDARRTSRPAAHAECGRLLDDFSLGDLADVEADEVPLATLKVVELVRALMADPKVLLLDEPAAGLSNDEVDALLVPLLDGMATRPRAVVIVEHDLELISRVCTRAYMLDFGSVLASGPPRDLLKRTDVLSAYLGASFVAVS